MHECNSLSPRFALCEVEAMTLQGVAVKIQEEERAAPPGTSQCSQQKLLLVIVIFLHFVFRKDTPRMLFSPLRIYSCSCYSHTHHCNPLCARLGSSPLVGTAPPRLGCGWEWHIQLVSLASPAALSHCQKLLAACRGTGPWRVGPQLWIAEPVLWRADGLPEQDT